MMMSKLVMLVAMGYFPASTSSSPDTGSPVELRRE